jgi:hypothetical protein
VCGGGDFIVSLALTTVGQGSARVTATTRAIYNSVKNKITIGRPLLSIRRLPPHVRIAIGPEIKKSRSSLFIL